MSVARKPNPVLEELRNNVEPSEDVNSIATELEKLTAKIHVAFLFEKEGYKTLHELCKWIGAVPVKNIYTNWCTFANYLNLTREQMKNIENWFETVEGPVMLTLKTYAQRNDATIKEVIHALWKMKRYDLIVIINDDVRKLVQCLSDRIDSEGILRPLSKPRVPFVLCSLDEPSVRGDMPITLNNTGPDDNRTISSPRQRSAFAAKVLLTFANDGMETAKRIAKIFRNHEPKIGTLILQEQSSRMFTEGTNFIDFILKQVDNIIPILSKGYLYKIKTDPTEIMSQSSLASDDQCVPYIYQAFKHEFVTDGCKSRRVRCILPNGMTQRDLVDTHMVVRAWVSEAEISRFIKNLLMEKKKASKAKKIMECNKSE